MNFNEIAAFIGKNHGLRTVAYKTIRITTLREWYVAKMLGKVIKNKQHSSFLDAGSGLGQYAVKVAKKYPKSSVTAIELDRRKVEDCTEYALYKKLSNLTFMTASLLDLNGQQQFDSILCNSVLEHIQDDVNVLLKLHSILKNNGYLILYVPMSERRVLSPLARIQYKMKKKSTTKLLHEHVRYYSKEEISSKLAQAGFEIKESHITYGHYGRYAYDIVTLVQYNRFFKLFFPFYFVFIHPYVMLLMWVDLIAENKTGNGLLVLAQKKD